MALTLKSERRIQQEIIARILSQLGITDINAGSVLDVLTQAIAQQDFSLYYAIAQISRLSDIDTLSGEDLDNRAFEYGMERFKAEKTKGLIFLLREDTFEKVSTTFYAGSSSAVTGDSTINVNDASNALYSTSGTLILGRGTNNEEEVDYSIAPVDNTTYWTFSLNTPLTKDHSIEETVILKQGNDEIVLSGTSVIVQATGISEEVKFTTDEDLTLLSGEDELEDVEVTAVDAGSSGNIPVGAINGTGSLPNPPFTGARAHNGQKFTTGRDIETDDELRDRIKNYIQGITKAVKQALLNAIVGLVDPVTAKRVVSASIVLPTEERGDVRIYLDDGDVSEPTYEDVGFETVRSNSTGGEKRLQVDNFPVSKAQIECLTEETYDFSTAPLTLQYEVGTISETITFETDDFRSPSAATAEEVVAVINDKSTLLEARTSRVGKYVLITAEVDVNESIRVTGGTANAVLNFSTDRKDTINVYVDDEKLSKDGQTATLDSGNEAPYDLLAIGSYPHTLTIVVDGKTANSLTATIDTPDVVDPSAVTVQEIIAVLNRDLVGMISTSINSGTKVRLQSLTLLSSSSKLHVTGGTLNNVTNGLNFSTSEVVGINGDYVFNRELGIIQLAQSLGANQNVTLNSRFTRAKLRASSAENYSPSNGQTLVISIDEGGDQTITFDSSFVSGLSAQLTANFINTQLLGGTAVVREVGGLNYLEIRTNTYSTDGSIEIKSSSTGNAPFSFTLDTEVSSNSPNKSYVVSGNSEPFDFAKDDALVVIVDNNIVDNTYNIIMSRNGTITNAVSNTTFRDSSLTAIFTTTDILKDFYVAFVSGVNTDTGTITDVSDEGAGVARYSYTVPPTNISDFNTGDMFMVTDLDDSENNGNFIITNVGADYVEVSNSNLVEATSQTGTGLLGQRRRVSTYNKTTGEIVVTTNFTNATQLGDTFVVLPSTIENLVSYMNNTKITSLSLKAVIEGVEDDSKLQISSQQDGSKGYIQVSGGNANGKLGFSIDLIRGLYAYNYWTGLVKLVHKTVYGDDSDLLSFSGVGAAGITFRILMPTIKQIVIELNVTLKEGISLLALENEIKSAVTGYVNTLGVGEDLVVERIRAAVIEIPGIVDVEINDPIANIAISDNEKVFVSDPDILIG